MLGSRTRALTALAVALTGGLLLSACSAGDLGSADGGDGKVTLSFLVDNEASTVAGAEALAKAFGEKNPDITVKVETRPQGGEGDNIVKTRLSTGDMADMFVYNSGSLFQALKPEQNLVALDDQPFAAKIDQAYRPTVTAGGKLYGAPFGGAIGGGILYNKTVYAELGLQVPQTWADFMGNNAKIKAAGKVAPVIQTYQDTWTSQVVILADYHNVATADPGFAEKYTTNKAKFATTPAALRSFEKLQEIHAVGYVNKDFASAKLEDGLKMLAEGKGAHFPMLTFTVATLVATYPDKAANIGFFALPGDDAAKVGLTVWEPASLYIPTTTTGVKLDAAKKFTEYITSPEGCTVMATTTVPAGPFVVEGCTLPDNVPGAIKDLQPYLDAKSATPALEFLSPIKGPSLQQITVEVGSGIRSAADGAALYDRDVEKQAQQLGLAGW